MILWDNVILFVVILMLWGVVTMWFPSLCLRPFLGEMRFGERILFYQLASVIYCMFLVYILGYLHICNAVSMIVGYVILPLAWYLYHKRSEVEHLLKKISLIFQDLTRGQYGLRLLVQRIRNACKRKVTQCFEKIGKRRAIEGGILFLILIGFILYFGSYKFTRYAYAAQDEEVHLYWIQSLIHNNLFPAGMYPHGMHGILAFLCVLLPVAEVRTVLNFSTVIIVINVLALYVMMKKVQRGSGTALAALIFLGMNGYFSSDAYSRFLYTIPMEFGMISLPAIAIAILNLIEKKTIQNRVFFILAVIYAISTHFYVGIVALVVCIAFGLVHVREILKQKRFLCFVTSAFVALLLSCLPFAVGYLLGYPFEQSMNWALGIMEGDNSQRLPDVNAQEEGGVISYWLDDEGGVVYAPQKVQTSDEIRDAMLTPKEKVLFRIRSIADGITSATLGCFQNEMGAIVVVGTGILVFLYGVAGCFSRKQKKTYGRFHLATSLTFFIMLFMVSFYKIDLPVIMDPNRIKVFLYLWFAVLLFGVFELTGARWKKEGVRTVITITMLSASIFLMVGTQNWERNRYVFCVNQEDTMYAVLQIMKRHPEQSYTIVSTQNEISILRYHGYHMEWIDFLGAYKDAEPGEQFTIPTEDVYFVIEKQMLDYGQSDYEADGWGNELLERVSRFYAGEEIEEEYFDKNHPTRSGVYKRQRSVVMSKAYRWALEYEKYYKKEFTRAYETDTLVVFHLKQNSYALQNLLLK